jgi:hypothetical protein
MIKPPITRKYIHQGSGVQAQREGRLPAPMDLLIGPHALSITAVLLTNKPAFGQLPGLSIEVSIERFRQQNGLVLTLLVMIKYMISKIIMVLKNS